MLNARLYGFLVEDERICGESLSEYIGSLERAGAATEELQRLKPLGLRRVNVVAKATTHKHSKVDRIARG